MAVLVRNLQGLVPVCVRQLREEAALLRGWLGPGLRLYDLGVLCVDPQHISHLNLTYRGQAANTDILAFPALQVLEAGRIVEPEFAEEYNLGDIYLGMECVEERSCEEGHSVHHMMVILLTHGLCHLVGYDHDTQEQWEKMYHKEMDILNKYNKKTGAQLKPITTVGH